MTQTTQMGEAELDSYIRVGRRNGDVEYFHVVNQMNVPITADAYAAATQEG